MPRGLVLLAIVVAVVACRTPVRDPVDVRTTQGPTAQALWTVRTLVESGREPTFEERRHWDLRMEDRIADYLRRHPEVANSLDVSTFRFERRVAVGMDKEQVTILLGPADRTTTEAAEIEKAARRYWSAIRDRATEMWAYPGGWHLYFGGDRLVDITQFRGE